LATIMPFRIESAGPGMRSEMTMTTTLTETPDGTETALVESR